MAKPENKHTEFKSHATISLLNVKLLIPLNDNINITT